MRWTRCPGSAETSSATDVGVSVSRTILSDRPADLEPRDRPLEQARRAAGRVIRRHDGLTALLPPHLETAVPDNPRMSVSEMLRLIGHAWARGALVRKGN